MLGCVHEPLPSVPHTRAGGRALGALRARPVRVEPGGGAARLVAARPSGAGYAEQCRQLSEARAAFPWLADGSVIVQQQALRDFHAAYASWFAALRQWRKRYARIPPEERPAAPSPPSWRKRDVNEGFRIVATGPQNVRRLNRRWAQVLVPKLGWVRFRLSRPVPDARSYRVTRDRAGRWHIAFAAVPAPIPGPATGEVVGIDRGVTVTLALSDGRTYQAPGDRDVKRLQRRLARAKRGSNRRAKVKARLARLHARNADARRDWAEKASTEIARGYDLIRIEDLDVGSMTRSARGTAARPGHRVGQKASLNRSILRSGWGMFATRLAHKARGRVEKVNPAYTSQRCSRCGTVDREARESRAAFRCRCCGYRANADHNAARNIAAGHAARGGLALAEPTNREPQLVASWVK